MYLNKYLKYKHKYLDYLNTGSGNKDATISSSLHLIFEDIKIKEDVSDFNLILCLGHDEHLRPFIEDGFTEEIDWSIYHSLFTGFNNDYKNIIIFFCEEYQLSPDDPFYKTKIENDNLLYVLPKNLPTSINKNAFSNLVMLMKLSNRIINKNTTLEFEILRNDVLYETSMDKLKGNLILEAYQQQPFMSLLLNKSIEILKNKGYINLLNFYLFDTKSSIGYGLNWKQGPQDVSEDLSKHPIMYRYVGNYYLEAISYFYIYLSYLALHFPNFSVSFNYDVPDGTYLKTLIKVINKVTHPSLKDIITDFSPDSVDSVDSVDSR